MPHNIAIVLTSAEIDTWPKHKGPENDIFASVKAERGARDHQQGMV